MKHFIILGVLVTSILVWACEVTPDPPAVPGDGSSLPRPMALSEAFPEGEGEDTAQFRLSNIGGKFRIETLDPVIRYEANGKAFELRIQPEDFEWTIEEVEEIPVGTGTTPPREG
jgi:hypothetical protein